MFRIKYESRDGDDLLAKAMCTLADPEISAGFNTRILSELAAKRDRRPTLFRAARPAAAAMAASFMLTLAVLSLTASKVNLHALSGSIKTAAAVDTVIDVDLLMTKTNLTSASVRVLITPQASQPHGASLPPKSNKLSNSPTNDLGA